MTITEAELDGLGEEERAALMDDEDQDAVADPDAGEVEAAEDDEPKGHVADTEGDDDTAKVEAEAGDQSPEQDASADDEPEVKKDPEPFVPEFRADPIADFDEQLQALNDRKKELRTQYQDGDLTLDEYEDQRDQVETEVLTLRERNFKASLAEEQQAQMQQQRWQWEVRRFLDDNPQYEKNETIFNSLNANVIALQNKAQQEGKNPNNPAILHEAKRQFDEALASILGSKPEDKPEQKAKPSRRPNATKDIPPNLGDMPSAEIPETGGDEWAHLNKLEGMELEAALAKMSEAEQDRYLKS